jgi:glutathione S-transferase
MNVHPLLQLPEDNPVRAFGARLADKYGCDAGEAEAAPERIAAILRMLSAQLARQREAGRDHLVGDAVSAADIFWAAACALVRPLPHDVCPMPDMIRASYDARHPVIEAAIDPALLEHRDRIYREHMEYPVVLE